jgi:short-subunit dehydrogenase
MRKILILGANSAIAQSVARIFVAKGDALFLVGRNPEKLDILVNDLKTRGGKKVGSLSEDLNHTEKHSEIIQTARTFLGGLDTVLIAHGELGKQEQAQANYEGAIQLLNTNFLSQVSLLTLLANDFEKQKSGTLAVISSVAGDRGRQSNYVYGTAKGAISIFLSGLRNRLFRSNVNVITFKLGFVDTPMTQEFKKGLLWASPDKVGAGIVRSIEKKRSIVYLPGFWFWIMWIIRSIPETIFKKLKL